MVLKQNLWSVVRAIGTSAVLTGALVVLTTRAPVASAAQVEICNDASLVELGPAVATSPSRGELLAVWFNDRAGNDDIRAQRLAADGSLLGGPFYVSGGPGADRRYPDVAYDSTNDQYLVVWEHYDQSIGYGIHGRRISGDGQVLDPADIEIKSAASLSSTARPAVAYASTSDRFLVAWAETWHPMPITYSVEAQVVTPAGGLEGGSVVVTSNSDGGILSVPDVAYNRRRNEHLVVWQERDPGSGLDDVLGRRLTGAGVVLGDPLLILYYTVSSRSPAVGAIPTVGSHGQYLVAGQVLYAPGDYDIYSATVNGDGSPGTNVTVTTTGDNEEAAAVASREVPQQHLVAWANPADPPPAAGTIHGRIVDSTGTALGTGGRSLAGQSPANPAIAVAAGESFLVVFEDTPAGGSTGIFGTFGGAVFVNGFESGDTSGWSATQQVS